MLPLPDYRYEVDIPVNHSATDGHFAAKPLLPGVVILEHVRLALCESNAQLRLGRFVRVKFTTPLLPNNRLFIILTKKNDKLYRFFCTDANENSIATGEFDVTL